MSTGLDPCILPDCSDGFDPLEYSAAIFDTYFKDAQKSIDNKLSETAMLDYVIDVFIPAIDQIESKEFND